MNYSEMKREYLKGWHTWNVRSVLSHVHMPDGFALNIAFKEYSSGHYLKETLIGRFGGAYDRTPVETAYPGPHAFDETYTKMTLRWCGMEICVESAVEEDELFLLVTPVIKQIRPAMLVVEGGFLWGRGGWIEKCGQTLVAHGSEGDKILYTTGSATWDPNIPIQTACLSVALDTPLYRAQ
jgi:putative isomerase